MSQTQNDYHAAKHKLLFYWIVIVTTLTFILLVAHEFGY